MLELTNSNFLGSRLSGIRATCPAHRSCDFFRRVWMLGSPARAKTSVYIYIYIYVYIYIYTSNNQECLGYMSAFYLTDLFHEDKCCHSISRNTSTELQYCTTHTCHNSTSNSTQSTEFTVCNVSLIIRHNMALGVCYTPRAVVIDNNLPI